MLTLWVASLPPPTSPPTAKLQLPGQRRRSQQRPQSRPVNQALNASPKAQTEGPLTVGGTGTTNYIPIWTNSTTLGNSILYQTGNNVGIGNTSPAGPLDVTGNTFIRGTPQLPAPSTATSSTGFNSQALDSLASAYNSSTPRNQVASHAAVSQHFRWQAEPVGNNTSSPVQLALAGAPDTMVLSREKSKITASLS